MRFHGALNSQELAQSTTIVKLVGKDRFAPNNQQGIATDCNVAQLVGEGEAVPHPHTR